jgi:hypothetical protein
MCIPNLTLYAEVRDKNDSLYQAIDFLSSNFDMAAKRRKKHKNKISGLVISMCYNEQKSKF